MNKIIKRAVYPEQISSVQIRTMAVNQPVQFSTMQSRIHQAKIKIRCKLIRMIKTMTPTMGMKKSTMIKATLMRKPMEETLTVTTDLQNQTILVN